MAVSAEIGPGKLAEPGRPSAAVAEPVAVPEVVVEPGIAVGQSRRLAGVDGTGWPATRSGWRRLSLKRIVRFVGPQLGGLGRPVAGIEPVAVVPVAGLVL